MASTIPHCDLNHAPTITSQTEDKYTNPLYFYIAIFHSLDKDVENRRLGGSGLGDWGGEGRGRRCSGQKESLILVTRVGEGSVHYLLSN